MARYSASIVSQTGQLTGVNATTTVNGYMGYWGGSATSGFRLRRASFGLLTSTTAAITSQQIALAFFRQTVAPAGTGIASAVLGQALETHTPQTDPTAGIFAITATSIGTTGPTLATNPFKTVALNSQNTVDYPWEGYEEVISSIGTANGIGFVLLGATSLPANSFVRLDVEIEV